MTVDTASKPPSWFGAYLRSRTDEELFRMLYERMRSGEFRMLLSDARRWHATQQRQPLVPKGGTHEVR